MMETVLSGDLEKAKGDYYQLMGWNSETGVPSKETLRDLGLEHVIPHLHL